MIRTVPKELVTQSDAGGMDECRRRGWGLGTLVGLGSRMGAWASGGAWA
jgi:hypothetical protein